METLISVWQCRAARGALQWSINRLSEESGLSTSTVVDFENDRRQTNRATLIVLELAFKDAGIEFTPDGGIRPAAAVPLKSARGSAPPRR